MKSWPPSRGISSKMYKTCYFSGGSVQLVHRRLVIKGAYLPFQIAADTALSYQDGDNVSRATQCAPILRTDILNVMFYWRI